MSESSGLRNFVGKAYLTRTLHEASYQPFLRRNLRDILEKHHEELSGAKTNVLPSDGDTSCERRYTNWTYPNSSELPFRSMNRRNPVLTIASLQLRRPSARADSTPGDRDNSSVHASSSHSDRTWALRCQIRIAISALHVPNKPLYVDLVEAICVRRTSSDGLTVFDVQPDSPVEIGSHKLLTEIEAYPSGGWRRGLREKYSLEISLLCSNSSDFGQLLSQLEGQRPDDYADLLPEDGCIRATWNHLPECPPVGKTLALSRTHGLRAVPLEYQVEIRIGWNQPSSPIVDCNRAQAALDDRKQLPTPSASEDLETSTERVEVTYQYRDGFQIRKVLRHDLTCILCRRKTEHRTIKRLFIHYISHHPHFIFDVDGEGGSPSEVTRITVTMRPASSPSASVDYDGYSVRPVQGDSWIAPAEPVNLVQYSQGHGPYVRPRPNESPKKTMRSVVTPSKVSAIPTTLGRRRAPPEDVVTLPNLKRKRHAVPNVPGVTFYRTTSKRPIGRDELLYESDDEIDDSWLSQRQRRELLELTGAESTVDFHELFNLHIDGEHPTADMLFQDAIVRFVRQHKDKFRDATWARLLQKKLRQIESCRVISKPALNYCLEQLPAQMAVDSVYDHMPKSTASQRVDGNTWPSVGRLPLDRQSHPNMASGTATSYGTACESILPPPETSRTRTEREDSGMPSMTDASLSKRRRWVTGKGFTFEQSSEEIPRNTSSPKAADKRLAMRNLTVILRRVSAEKERMLSIADFLVASNRRLCDDSLQKTGAIESADLDYNRFISFLDDPPLEYIRDRDRIVCISNNTMRPITCEADWKEALLDVSKATDEVSPLLFELLSDYEFQRRLEEESERHRQARRSLAPPERQRSKTSNSHACACGELVFQRKGTIICAGSTCPRAFHLSCVGLDHRALGWRCDECQGKP